MSDYLVKELMVPLSEYATVPKGSTLFDAILALEKAQEDYDHTRYKHRAILILDKKRRVIGKLSQLDVLRALEPNEEDSGQINDISQFGFSSNFIQKLRAQWVMNAKPFKDLCSKASKLKVENFMQTPTEGEIIDQDASLEMAVMQLVMGHHISLLVTRDKEIIGILRLSDAFAAVFHTMKECEI
ncbi:MAG: CBS domain-containing protein [Desulfobacteraceae bacterium]|nr:CBS domain-containing protein [Desulfobacteraceae bacterium]